MAVYTNPTHRHQIVEFRVCIPVPNGVHKSRYRRLERKNVKCLGRMEANQVSCNAKKCRQGGGIEPLHVSMPRELKSRPSTSPTHPGLMRKQKTVSAYQFARRDVNQIKIHRNRTQIKTQQI